MIKKSFELNSKLFEENNLFLFYGKNDAQKKNVIDNLINNNEFLNYEQSEIIEKKDYFFDEIYTKSLFEDKKIIIIKRISDKILTIIEDIKTEKIENTIVILIADILDKKSKLRLKFEKDKKLICIAFYPDNRESLFKLASNFFRANKIPISSSSINTIIDMTNNDRGALLNEIEKIKLYTIYQKKIDDKKILKIVNLNENHEISELVNNCLIKNKKKTIHILNDNNFSNEDCMLITRTFLNKTKTILKLSKEYEINKNINTTISSAKPPIFWKEKEITKQQILNWKTKNLKKLLYEIMEIELLLKKNINFSLNILTNFILEKSSI